MPGDVIPPDVVENPPEPVFKWTMIVPIIMSIESTAVIFWTAFAGWRPTVEQTAALGSIQAPLVLIIGFLTAWKARNQVTPTVKVDALVAQATSFSTPAHPGGNADV